MKLTPALAEKAAILTETSDDLLPLFAPMERAVILALKGLMRSEGL